MQTLFGISIAAVRDERRLFMIEVMELEKEVAKPLEHQVSKVSPDVFLWAAGGSIIASLALNAVGHRHSSLFVGQWAPTFLLLGVYKKLVSLHETERASQSL